MKSSTTNNSQPSPQQQFLDNDAIAAWIFLASALILQCTATVLLGFTLMLVYIQLKTKGEET
jgi:hypothetical protein